jgi:hypothetical protein
MNYLGTGDKIVDGTKSENLVERVFEFCTKKEDYFLNYFLNWDKIIGDVYQLKIGNHNFNVGSGFYVFIGCDDADGDWAIIDEIIGRDIQIFTLDPKISTWSFNTPTLKGVNENTTYYYPMTRSPIPVVSNDGQAMIMVSSVDQYRSTKERDHLAMFIM